MTTSSISLRIKARLAGTRIEKNVSLTSANGITIGKGCLIEAFATINGSSKKGRGVLIGNHVRIRRFSRISAPDSKITLYDNSYVGYGAWLGGKGNIVVGQNAMISINTVVVSSNHDYGNITVPYIEGIEIADDIIIAENVWIGSNCVILPGVRIGENSVIGAGAVVSKTIPPNTLAVGIPAKPIKKIGSHVHYQREKLSSIDRVSDPA